MAFGIQIHYQPILENLLNTLYGSLSNSIMQCTLFYIIDKWIYDNVHTKKKQNKRRWEHNGMPNSKNIFLHNNYILCRYFFIEFLFLNSKTSLAAMDFDLYTVLYMLLCEHSFLFSWLVWSNFKCVDRPVQILQKLTFK